MHALKRELSLDLQTQRRLATLPVKDQLQAAASSPNNSNFTDNTSQSVTPSEFGYQHLQRQLSMHSLLATEDSSPYYEDFDQTPQKQPMPHQQLASPIKSTISITYKSPEKEKAPSKPAPLLLETNFDEHIVYEQVKLFRNSVTEVNQLLNERHAGQSLKQIDEEQHHNQTEQEMTQQLLELEQESSDLEQEQLLYENIELRKPKTVYENLRGEEMKLNTTNELELDSDLDVELDVDSGAKPNCSDRIELDSLDSLPSIAMEPSSKSPSFSVKELANKFESSPVEQLPNFDFTQRGGSMKKPNELSLPPVAATAPKPLKKLNNAQKITRSLDENAFVREFGGKQLQDLSVCKVPELPELNNRRKSFDFTRPKTLNPPKRLPGMSITEEICQKTDQQPQQQLIITTPTTENRISLIQQNNVPRDQQQQQQQSQTLNLPQAGGRKSVLTGVILDRERIDKIKEERRQQLTQKYYGDTLKSRSKTELNSDENNFQAPDSLRIKSKSRGDMNTLQKDMDMNLKQLARAGHGSGSESTLHHHASEYGTAAQRVRSISDEKNQNCDSTTTATNTSGAINNLSVHSVKSAAQKFAQNNASTTTIISAVPASGKYERGAGMTRERLSRNSLPAPESNASVK